MSDPVYVEVAMPLPIRRTFTYLVPGEMDPPPLGSRVRVPFGSVEETGIVIGGKTAAQLDDALRKHPDRIKPLALLLDPEPWLDEKLLRLGHWLAAYYGSSLGEALRAMIPIKPMKRPRGELPGKLPRKPSGLSLTEAQSSALDEINLALADDDYGAFLLHGITGSGKTEVYLRAIDQARGLGRQSIVLVPEISLTPQMARRFRSRLGERVGVFHSGLSASERFLVWRAARQGQLDVVLGARSAVFAPLPRLGLIILDEEHDSSYKQTEKPRYHARSVALLRASHCGAVAVLGSATPSLESLHNAAAGKLRLLPLPDRVGGGRRPSVEVLDMREEPGEVLSSTLLDAIAEAAARGEKIMLLLNRRGHSRQRLCRHCGEGLSCSRCEIPLTYHSGRNLMLCHYCGQTRRLPDSCPSCGERGWILLGAGTQQLEMDLAMRFPELRLLRMDLDSTSARGAHARLLDSFAAPGAALLLGTQMIAKGHHFPEVTLVGVVSADTGLFLPDFRAAERTWQLLEQVSGRAGRGNMPGRVLIQTFNPEHPVLKAISDQTPRELIEAELSDRRLLGYPPFRRLLSLVVSDTEADFAERAAEKLAERFRGQWPDHPAEILGPVEAVFARLKGRYRWQIVIKGSLSRDQKEWFHESFALIRKQMRRSSTMTLDLDVDPETIL